MSQRHRSTFAEDPEIRPLLERFVQRLPEYVSQLRAAQAAGDSAQAAVVAHKLKGAGASYGFEPLTALAAAAESALQQNSPAAADACDALLAYVLHIDGYPASPDAPT